VRDRGSPKVSNALLCIAFQGTVTTLTSGNFVKWHLYLRYPPQNQLKTLE